MISKLREKSDTPQVTPYLTTVRLLTRSVVLIAQRRNYSRKWGDYCSAIGADAPAEDLGNRNWTAENLSRRKNWPRQAVMPRKNI
eukprot:6196110-Pleurochrysis_carterae.AAC.2